MSSLWALCLGRLEDDLSPQQFNTWIRPLQAIEESGQLRLLAPNQFVKDFVSKEMLEEISKLIGGSAPSLSLLKSKLEGDLHLNQPAARLRAPARLILNRRLLNCDSKVD